MIMKLSMIAGVIVFAFATNGAMAACASPSTQVTDSTTPSLTNLLSGNTVCVAGPGGTWKYQEQHIGTGSPGSVLNDYKMGPAAPGNVDPTKQVGTWEVSGTDANTTVTYNYGTSGPYTYKVWDNTDGTYSFCGTDTVIFTRKSGTSGGCPP